MRRRNPTRAEKIAISEADGRLKIANWLVVDKRSDAIVLQHKLSDTRRTVLLKEA